jgi:excisionase family DNA binding protein
MTRPSDASGVITQPENQSAERVNPPSSQWFTTEQAAHYSGYSVWWIRELARRGKLRSRQPSPYSHRRINRNDLDAFLAGETVTA